MTLHRMFIASFFLMFLYSSIYPSSQEVSGTISTNTSWKSDTIKVTSDIIISEGITLSINPGTYVEFQGHYKIDVKGIILAQGTENDSIIFTVSDTTGFGNTTIVCTT